VPEALAFYSDGVYTLETEDPAVLARHLDRAEPAFAVVDSNELGRQAPELLGQLTVVATATLSRQKVLLATNGGGR